MSERVPPTDDNTDYRTMRRPPRWLPPPPYPTGCARRAWKPGWLAEDLNRLPEAPATRS
ncbi:hypothetical protein GCM10023324_64860 [Streptomyces youssoufiensis]